MKPIYQKKFVHTYELERKAYNFQSMSLFILIAVSCISIVLLYIWLKVKNTSLGFEISYLEKHEGELKLKNEDLKLKCEMLHSLDRIEKIARERLEMQIPEKVKIITLQEEK
ncbi:MAG: cell division protein FtsL [Candidatus Firestonebacteria bacterium]|nr:cell division protein FtsL [Candidatus Firestonebacteria bacterium]